MLISNFKTYIHSNIFRKSALLNHNLSDIKNYNKENFLNALFYLQLKIKAKEKKQQQSDTSRQDMYHFASQEYYKNKKK